MIIPKIHMKMKWKLIMGLTLITVLSKVDTVSSNNDHDRVLNKETFFNDDRIIYRSNYTIQNLLLVVRTNVSSENEEINLFFNQVNERKQDGAQDESGQYILTRRDINDTVVRKIFNGKCSASDPRTGKVYFGAEDGMYEWDHDKYEARRLGNLSDNIKQMYVTTKTEQIYFLAEPANRIYKVDLKGMNKILVENIPSVTAFAIDMKNNIYFCDEDRALQVLKANSDQPMRFSSLNVHKDVLFMKTCIDCEDSVPAMVDDQFYILYSNGTTQKINNMLMGERVTSASIESPIVLYFAIDGNIYEINIVLIILNGLFAVNFKKFF